MCWHQDYHTGKTVRRVPSSKPKHANVTPYKRTQKHKMSAKDYQ